MSALRYSHKKKSVLDKSGERPGQATGPPLPIHPRPSIEVITIINTEIGWSSMAFRTKTRTLSSDSGNTSSRKMRYVVPLSRCGSKYVPIRRTFTIPAHTLTETYSMWVRDGPNLGIVQIKSFQGIITVNGRTLQHLIIPNHS
ncbi:hypothetical protein AVEN_54583-1 [Araneus ventricosus]|uniref:Uncharacterized protein n=1 Tax=Araneus ventricosus TaxID=182803 RepID=A0A4Y2BLI5_ARAVE|nr:hypothetical protein AVEN_54583-1 [Araneus ventricosus]